MQGAAAAVFQQEASAVFPSCTCLPASGADSCAGAGSPDCPSKLDEVAVDGSARTRHAGKL